MDALAIAVPYVLFVWWFSTGAILFVVGASGRHDTIMKIVTAPSFVAALAGIAASSRVDGLAGVYCVFTCAILIWGTIELSLLNGWITGPRPEPCPRDCAPRDRLWFALQAIAYHEFALIATAGLVFSVTRGAPNQVGWWTFLALLVLRQSAKINLFLGVPTLNDELLPERVRFLKSYFRKSAANPFFLVSATVATLSAVALAVLADKAGTHDQAIGLALVAVLVALGALEHWFMVLPMPVVDLWRWAVRSTPKADATPVIIVETPVVAIAEPPAAPLSKAALARQRLEDQFREAYYAHQESAGRIQNHVKLPV